jgi:molecular chaperone DnaJ
LINRAKFQALRGAGLPEVGGRHSGDLMVRLQGRVPERISAEERKLYERLRTLADDKR